MNDTNRERTAPTRNRLVLDESVMMCVGTCCPMRSKCWRYRLDRFFDTIARTPHSNPRWLEPAYSREHGCPFFRPVKWQE